MSNIRDIRKFIDAVTMPIDDIRFLEHKYRYLDNNFRLGMKLCEEIISKYNYSYLRNLKEISYDSSLQNNNLYLANLKTTILVLNPSTSEKNFIINTILLKIKKSIEKSIDNLLEENLLNKNIGIVAEIYSKFIDYIIFQYDILQNVFNKNYKDYDASLNVLIDFGKFISKQSYFRKSEFSKYIYNYLKLDSTKYGDYIQKKFAENLEFYKEYLLNVLLS